MTENSFYIIHQISMFIAGKMTFDKHEEDHINTEKYMKHLISIYKKRSKMTTAEIRKSLKNDIIWGVNECMKKGVVDEIWNKSSSSSSSS